MRDYAIITDSGCDLPQEIVEELGIDVVPMGLVIDNVSYKHYHDFRELSKEKFYNLVRSGYVGKTAGVNISDVYDAVKEKVQQGLDVLYLSFSSSMSSSYQYAAAAITEVQEEYPDATLKIIDTKAGCLGLGLLTYLTALKKKSGASIYEAVEYAEQNSLKMCHFFMVNDLKYIQKSGRISSLKAALGTILNVKPIFKLNNDGAVAEDCKVRGKNAGIAHMIKRLKTKCEDASTIFIAHADVEEDALIIKEKVQEAFPDSNIIVSCLGPILGNNTGPGTLAILFHGTSR